MSVLRGQFDDKLKSEVQRMRLRKEKQGNNSDSLSQNGTPTKNPVITKVKKETPKIAPRKEKPASFSSGPDSPMKDSQLSSPSSYQEMTSNQVENRGLPSTSSSSFSALVKTEQPSNALPLSSDAGTTRGSKSAILKMDLELSSSSDSD